MACDAAYHRVLDVLSDMVMGFDTQLRFSYVNGAVETLLGVQREHLLGRSIKEKGYMGLEEVLQRCKHTGEEQEADISLTLEGCLKCFSVRIIPQTCTQSEGTAILAIWREEKKEPQDFYEQKGDGFPALQRTDHGLILVKGSGEVPDIQNDILQLEREKNLILNSITESCMLYNLNMEIVWMNRQGEILSGTTAEESVGKKCYAVRFRRESPCRECPLENVKETGEVQTQEVQVGETTLLLRCYPVFDQDGEVQAFLEMGMDITRRKAMENNLHETSTILEALFQNTPNFLSIFDHEGRYRYVSDSVVRFMNRDKRAIIGNTFADLLPEKVREEFHQAMNYVQETGQVFHKNETIKLNGDRNFETWVFPVLKHENHVKFFGTLSVDVTARRRDEERLRYLSRFDQLTGLYNRLTLEQKMGEYRNDEEYPISILLADINGLKLINEGYGHGVGDQILSKAASVLKECCRKEDLLGRWGGDEFIALLPRTTQEEAQAICTAIRERSKSIFVGRIPLTLSVGAACFHNRRMDIFQAIKEAEDVMNKEKLTESKSARSNILSTLLTTLGEKSHETEEHALRMQALAYQLGNRIGLSFSDLNSLTLLVSLHDIGKITIPREILVKNGSLTAEEWEIIKKHPETGYRIASETLEFGHVAEDILAHHERWDGQGYPRGLKGREIPLLARITTIVDAYDVMTTGRPYKKAISIQEAMEELKRCAGKQFDPELVEAFVQGLMQGEWE